jgi:hypothetical protein
MENAMTDPDTPAAILAGRIADAFGQLGLRETGAVASLTDNIAKRQGFFVHSKSNASRGLDSSERNW